MKSSGSQQILVTQRVPMQPSTDARGCSMLLLQGFPIERNRISSDPKVNQWSSRNLEGMLEIKNSEESCLHFEYGRGVFQQGECKGVFDVAGVLWTLETKSLWKIKLSTLLARAPLCSNDKGVDMMNESFWTDVDFVRENLDPSLHSYVVSKTLIERAALEFGAEHGLNMVTLIPTYVVGPFICPKLPETLCSPLGLVLVPWQKLLDTGFKFNYGVEEMFEGAIGCCKEKGYI
ncbi:hypothetical protein V6N12_054130 [Hibiscus sabdariffa]|uniref:Uncharacterized protein n=1 Tax=Hibiscus sabdariffa TaxID=183260 RepID=A0ABR2B7Z4_9ROSI